MAYCTLPGRTSNPQAAKPRNCTQEACLRAAEQREADKGRRRGIASGEGSNEGHRLIRVGRGRLARAAPQRTARLRRGAVVEAVLRAGRRVQVQQDPNACADASL